MTKVKFEFSTIKNSIFPSIQNTCDYLDNVINEFDAMSIPYAFQYSSYLQESKKIFTEIKTELKNMEDWLYDSNNAFENSLEKMTKKLTALHNQTIEEKISIIKE